MSKHFPQPRCDCLSSCFFLPRKSQRLFICCHECLKESSKLLARYEPDLAFLPEIFKIHWLWISRSHILLHTPPNQIFTSGLRGTATADLNLIHWSLDTYANLFISYFLPSLFRFVSFWLFLLLVCVCTKRLYDCGARGDPRVLDATVFCLRTTNEMFVSLTVIAGAGPRCKHGGETPAPAHTTQY